MAIEVTRTYVGFIQNHRQVRAGLDSLGDAASKIWNVARWTADRIDCRAGDAIGEIPGDGVLKSYMKTRSCWKDLNAQSSQTVIEERSGAFQSWRTCSRCGDDTKSNRVERGLYVCSSCERVANADCNGAENMRQKITPSPHGGDRSNGCVAQPSTHQFDRESGLVRPREQVVS